MTHTNNCQLIQAKLNPMKPNRGLWAFYAIRPANGSDLFSGDHMEPVNEFTANITVNSKQKQTVNVPVSTRVSV